MQPAGELAQLLVGLAQLVEDRVDGALSSTRARSIRSASRALTSRCCAPSWRLRSSRGLVVGGLDQPRARFEQPLARVRARDRERRELGERDQLFLGVQRQRLGVESGDDQRAPDAALDLHRRRRARAQPVGAASRPSHRPRRRSRRSAPAARSRAPSVSAAAAVEREAHPRRERLARELAPAPDERRGPAAEAHDRAARRRRTPARPARRSRRRPPRARPRAPPARPLRATLARHPRARLLAPMNPRRIKRLHTT